MWKIPKFITSYDIIITWVIKIKTCNIQPLFSETLLLLEHILHEIQHEKVFVVAQNMVLMNLFASFMC